MYCTTKEDEPGTVISYKNRLRFYSIPPKTGFSCNSPRSLIQ